MAVVMVGLLWQSQSHLIAIAFATGEYVAAAIMKAVVVVTAHVGISQCNGHRSRHSQRSNHWHVGNGRFVNQNESMPVAIITAAAANYCDGHSIHRGWSQCQLRCSHQLC